MMFMSYLNLREYFSSCHNHPWNSSTTILVLDVIEPLSTIPMYYRWSSLFSPDDYESLFDTIDRLSRLADKQHWQKLDTQKVIGNQELDSLFINSFIPELRQFVTARNLQLLYEYDISFFSKKRDKSPLLNEILVGYLVFLLQILDSEGTFWSGYRKHLHSILHKNLTFLLTILGDTPFCRSEREAVKNFFVELEYESKATWNFIYSSTFAPSKRKRKKNFDAGIHALLRKMDRFLTENLTNYIIKLVELPKTTMNPNSSRLHSPFVVDSLLNNLEGLVGGLFNLNIDDIKDQIKMLIKELATIQTGLKDIEIPQVTDIADLKRPIIQIREVAYETEYLINTYVMRRLPSWYLNLRLPHIVKKVMLNGRGLQQIKESYKVKNETIVDGINRVVPYEAIRNPEDVVESIVIGFEDIRTKILADLTRGCKKLKTISVYGMPGIGKTTLAKEMYNDRAVYQHFDLRAWCVVSQTFEKTKVLNDILISLASKSKNNILQSSGESLGLDIYRSLYGRRYLIVLDDVWCSSLWEDLGRFFPDVGNGSRVLLTSRIKDTAPTDSIFYAHPLLSESQCCDLLVKKVFINEPCPPDLLGIARRITSKCYGLPLAVVVVAGILANLRKEKYTWSHVEANLNSCISDDQSKYMKILELSFENLPDHLKPCFLYLGRFDEDEEIPMWKVIPLWIAEGIVHNKEDKSLEHIAEEYYSDLVNRSLLMISKRKGDGAIKACRIHDLLRDMCIRKGIEGMFLKHMNKSSIYEQHSHLVLHTSRSNTLYALHCRSLSGNLLSFGYNVAKMPLLRVIDGLELKSSSVYEMERIWSLVHLKYLSFSAPKFPTELYKLVNLEYFHLDIDSIVSVPANILKMVKLKHVCITTEAVFEKSCNSFRTMNNLKSLSYVLIRNEEEDEILRCSPHLRKLKYVCDGSLFPDLKTLTELESLTMDFTNPPQVELTGSYFPSTIKKLSLYGTSLPWEKMPIVGSLPNLHVLKLFDCAFVGEMWNTRYGEFGQLRFLSLEDLNLKQWITSNDHLPRLQCLVLESITNLMEIPFDIGDITTLERIEVRNCSYEIERSAVQIEEEQRDYGNEDLKVIITNAKRIQIEEWEVELVMFQADVSRARAVRAIKKADGDLVEAIMKQLRLRKS